MVRGIAVVLFVGCLTVPAWWIERAQGQDSAGQNSAAAPSTQPAAPAQPTDASAAKPGFPFDEFPEFSAIMTGSLQARDKRETYMYRADNLLRTSGPLEKAFFLTDLKTQVAYSMSSLGCVKDGHPYFRSWPFIAARPGHRSERVPVGKETLDGHVCQIEDVTISGSDLVVPTKLRFWEAEDLHGFPIKVEDLNSKGNRMVLFSDVSIGPQDPTLFIYPKDCEGRLPQPGDKGTRMSNKPMPKLTPPPPLPNKSQQPNDPQQPNNPQQ
jgi:hypothetical protein